MALTGRVPLLAALGVLLLFVVPGWGSFAVIDLVIVALVALDIALAGSVRSLRLTRGGGTRGRQGEPVELTLAVVNGGRRRVRAQIRDAWEPSAGISPRTATVVIPAGERRRLASTLTPTRRGDRRPIRITVRSTGPLGLAARQGRHVVPWTVRVLPPFTSRRFLASRLERLRQVEGAVAIRGAGRGAEFDSLREYVPGDDVRTIDWRATARSTVATVRTYRPERDRRLMILLDTGRTSAARLADGTRLDSALDASLLLAALAERAGDRVDLLAYDAVVRADLASGRTALLPSLVESMALLEPSLLEADHRVAVTSLLARGRRRGLVVLFTDLNAAAIDEGLLPVIRPLVARHTVVVAAVTDPEVAAMRLSRGDAPAVYDAAAAERATTGRRRIATELRRVGVDVVEAAPAVFAPAVADAYLELKASGRL